MKRIIKHWTFLQQIRHQHVTSVLLYRLTSGAEVYPKGNGSAASDRSTGAICNYYLRNYRPWIFQRCLPQGLQAHRQRWDSLHTLHCNSTIGVERGLRWSMHNGFDRAGLDQTRFCSIFHRLAWVGLVKAVLFHISSEKPTLKLHRSTLPDPCYILVFALKVLMNINTKHLLWITCNHSWWILFCWCFLIECLSVGWVKVGPCRYYCVTMLL